MGQPENGCSRRREYLRVDVLASECSRSARHHQTMLAMLDDLAVLIDQLRREYDDPPACAALARAHRAHAEFHVQHVVDLDRQIEVPRPAERHAWQETVFALGLEPIGDGRAKQTMRGDRTALARVSPF